MPWDPEVKRRLRERIEKAANDSSPSDDETAVRTSAPPLGLKLRLKLTDDQFAALIEEDSQPS